MTNIKHPLKNIKKDLKNKKDFSEIELNEMILELGNREKEDDTPKELKEEIVNLMLALEKIRDEKFPKKDETPKKESVKKFETAKKSEKIVIQDTPKKQTITFEEHLAQLQDLKDKGIFETMDVAKNSALKTLRGYIKSFENQIIELVSNPDNVEYCQELETRIKSAKTLIDQINPPTPKKEHAPKIDTLTLDYSDMYKILKTDEKEFAEICMSLELLQTSYNLNPGCLPFMILTIMQGKESDILFQDGKDSFNSKSVLYRTEKIFYNVFFFELLKKHFANELVWNWIKLEDSGFCDIADYVLSNYVETAKEETETVKDESKDESLELVTI